MKFVTERLSDVWTWWRIADRSWSNPLDPSYAALRGGRWNPAQSFDTLYLNEDQVSARMNLRAFIADWPYEPEDLRSENGPVLVGARLPRAQEVCDAHSPGGFLALGLPRSYPVDSRNRLVPRSRCQPLGALAHAAGLRGIRSRSAQAKDGAGRELAWFPATTRSVAKQLRRVPFADWYWA
ncbi:MAG TPA: RES domain-containing protein [Woeseiaceae bacterium]|nr:RES domain-containing protein [Woeseiaceae bacterium]